MIRQKYQEKPCPGDQVTFSVGYSQCAHTQQPVQQYSCAQEGMTHNLLLLLGLTLHLPLLPYSLTSGTFSRVYCRAELPGKGEGSPQTAAGQFFLVVPTASPLAVVHGSVGKQRLKPPLAVGLQHIKELL